MSKIGENSAEMAERRRLVDLYGETVRLASLWQPQVNPHLAKLEELETAIAGWYTDYPADQGDVVRGARYQLEVKAQQFQRTITPQARSKVFYKMRMVKTVVAGKIQRIDPFAFFTVTQDAIKKILGEAFLDQIAPRARTGRRVFDVVALAPAVPAEKAA